MFPHPDQDSTIPGTRSKLRIQRKNKMSHFFFYVFQWIYLSGFSQRLAIKKKTNILISYKALIAKFIRKMEFHRWSCPFSVAVGRYYVYSLVSGWERGLNFACVFAHVRQQDCRQTCVFISKVAFMQSELWLHTHINMHFKKIDEEVSSYCAQDHLCTHTRLLYDTFDP